MPSRASKEARLGRHPNRNNKPNLGRTKSESGLAKSMAASGKKVSGTNLGRPSSPAPSKPPRARRSPLATPEVQSAVERLRSRYTDSGRTVEEARRQTEANVRQRESRVDDIAASQVQPNPTMSRTDFIGQQNQARQNTTLSSDGKTVKKFRGKGIVGTPSTKSVAEAAKEGSLRGKNRLTTPEVRQTKRQVRKARRQVRRARAQMRTGIEGPLTPGQKKFAEELAKRTAINPRVAGAWVLSEMSGSYATGREAEGNHNWLNIAYFDSGPGSITKDAVWSDPVSAAKASAQFLRGQKFGPSEGIKGILPQARGASDERQIQAIANSGWASSGYDGGDSLRGTRDLVGFTPPKPGAKRRLERAKTQAAKVDERAKGLGIQGVRGESPNKVPKAGEPRFVNFSQDGAGTSNTKWLIPTGGNEVLKFQKPLGDALIALAKASGEPIEVNSAYRSNEEQAALYQAYLNGTGNLAAPPGQSNHNHGAAVDVNLTPGQRELAGQFGLGFPVAGEDWHMELVGDAAGQIVSSGGGGGTSYSSGGGGTSTTSGGVASGPSGRKRRQVTILEKLRELGYRVTPEGVFRVGEGRQTKTEYEKAKERVGIK